MPRKTRMSIKLKLYNFEKTQYHIFMFDNTSVSALETLKPLTGDPSINLCQTHGLFFFLSFFFKFYIYQLMVTFIKVQGVQK